MGNLNFFRDIFCLIFLNFIFLELYKKASMIFLEKILIQDETS